MSSSSVMTTINTTCCSQWGDCCLMRPRLRSVDVDHQMKQCTPQLYKPEPCITFLP